MGTFLNLIAGAGLGLASSLVAWLLIVTRFVPRFSISHIEKTVDPNNPNNVEYYIRVVNGMKKAALVEINLVLQVGLTHVTLNEPDDRVFFDIPVGGREHFPIVKNYVSYRLRTAELGLGHPSFPRRLAQRLAAGTTTLDDLLEEHPEAEFRVAVIAAHSRSGLRTGQRVDHLEILDRPGPPSHHRST